MNVTSAEATNVDQARVPTVPRAPRIDLDRDVGGLSPRPPIERALAGLLVVLTVGSVLAIGTVHVVTLAVAALFAILAAVLAAKLGRTSAAVGGIPSRVLPLLALAAYTGLQAVPLPLGWLHRLAPATADVWERALIPLGQASSHGALSLDPSASLVECLKLCVYACIFVAAFVTALSRGGVWGIALVFGSGTAAALTTIAHGLAGATKVFGIYEPSFPALQWHVGPLLNPNNLAGYLNLSVLCGVGLLLSRRPILSRWLIGVGVMIMVAVAVTTASSGGVLFLLTALLAFAGLFRLRVRGDRSEAPSGRVIALIAATIGGGLLFAALAGTRALWSELYSKNLEKLEMVLWVKPLIAQHPWFGIGRGAFESVFPAHRITAGHVVFTHIESFPAQWVTEWGVPVGSAALILLCWLVWPTKLGAFRSSVATGGWLGAVALLCQNLFDLALEVPAVAIALFAVLGTLSGGVARRRRPGSVRYGATRASWLALPIVSTLALAAVIAWGRTSLADERAHLRDAYGAVVWDDVASIAALRERVRLAMLRHPAEPYFPLLGATIAWRARDQDPMPWLQRTLERAPTSGRAHLLLAEVLTGRGARRQGLFELRLALENDSTLIATTAQMALRWASDYTELLVAVPEGAQGAAALDAFGAMLAATKERELRIRCDQEAISRDPHRTGPRMRLASDILTALATGKPFDHHCADGQACRKMVDAHAAAIAEADPRNSGAAQLRARLLLLDGKPQQADQLLAHTCDTASDRIACLTARVNVAAEVTAPEAMKDASRQYLASACVTPVACADAESWLGDVRSRRGELQAALQHYTRAARSDSSEQRWLKLADAAVRAGAHLQAVEALEKVLHKRGGADPELSRRLTRERARVSEQISAP